MPRITGLSDATSTARISVCVPSRDLLHAVFAYDLTRMFQANPHLDLRLQINCGTIITNQREQLLREAREAGSTHVLWLDSDMMFPPDTPSRLLQHNVPVVAGNYATRQAPHKTVAYTDTTDWSSYVTHGTEQGSDLITVQAVGMGCMLIRLRDIAQLESPVFELRYEAANGDHLGEDFVFCEKLRGLGLQILIDPLLSLQLQHLGTRAFGHGCVRPGLL